jgi:2-polyprenyl-6-methoxyphenol hydroxylase-like FAD-dependent oxidoreductase
MKNAQVGCSQMVRPLGIITNMSPIFSPIVIVGSGPTGATLALLLAQQGIPVTLVEASPTFRRIFRGEALMPSGLDALDQMGLLPIVQQIPHRALDAWEFIIEDRSLFRVAEPMQFSQASASLVESVDQACTLVSQPALLEQILQRINEFSYCQLIQGTAVQDVLWQSDSLLSQAENRVIGVRLANGLELNSSLVIGADGRNSVVRQAAGLSLVQQDQPFDILWFKLMDEGAIASWMPDSNRSQSQSKSQSKSETANVFSSILKQGQAFGVFRSAEGSLQIGWSVHGSLPEHWQQIDWAETIAAVAPPQLADHLRRHASRLERPIRLSVMVGRCPQWCQPGLLLLGDAAHPMSPIRAQGINMALRDVVVALNWLVPLFRSPGADLETAIDTVLPKIQAEREPEIIRIQQLQSQETAQAKRLVNLTALRWLVSRMAPVVGDRIQASWLKRQRELRLGVTEVKAKIMS